MAAAERLFADRGFGSVTIAEIARAAQVSLATVYLYFPAKAAIVSAMADELASTPDLSVEAVEQEADALTQLEIGVRIIRTLNERSWLVTHILRSAHGADPQLAQVWKVWQERHLHAITRGVTAIEQHGGLRPGLDVDEAVDILYALAGTEVYRLLVEERGWDADQYERWLYRMCRSELMGRPIED
jgi:AcrR family transcriptional regulator